MRKGATAAWYYTYDANGMRTSRTNGTTTYNYVYDGSLLKELTVGANTLRFTYDASGTPLTVTFNGTTYYYVTNLQGDVTAILTQARNPVVNYTYDAWGNILTFSGSLATTLGRYNPLTYGAISTTTRPACTTCKAATTILRLVGGSMWTPS